jgi:hypothetical protein
VAEFTMMEKSTGAEFSAAGRSYPPYGAGNNHNTWYGATLIDATGKEVPYMNRDGEVLKSVEERFMPAKGQNFFLKGGSIDNPKYEIEGPETVPFSKLLEEGYKLPFYADLSDLPEMERKVIWGMMVGEEGKTKIPVYNNYSKAGFDPERHVLQCYGTGWTSASFLPQERQLFGLPGGFLNDWKLSTSLDGLFVAGDALYASNCYGHAAATGYYAGRHAIAYALGADLPDIHIEQVEQEKRRVYAPIRNKPENSVGWKELNEGIAKTMQNYCGEIKYDDLLEIGLARLGEYEKNIVPETFANNPHELVRLLEVFDILTNAQLILHASLARKHSSKPLNFLRGDNKEEESPKARKLIVLKQVESRITTRELPIDFYGNLKENYEKYNSEYINTEHHGE